MNNELSVVYAEIDEILKNMDEKYVQKIPQKLRDLIQNEKSLDYKPNIKVDEDLNKQGLHRKTLVMLAMFNLNYWCENEEEKNNLVLLYSDNDKKMEELIPKYGPEDLFKKKAVLQEDEEIIGQNTQNVQMVEYKKENFFQKIINKIINVFKK